MAPIVVAANAATLNEDLAKEALPAFGSAAGIAHEADQRISIGHGLHFQGQ
jgi:hypothetical protein